MKLRPFRVLIIGGGLTGSVTAALIKQHFPTDVEICVWEKARGVGGRMTTNRSSNGMSRADLGAQYITKTGQYAEKHRKYFDELLQAGVLKVFPGNIDGATVQDENFMAPQGISSVVKHFLSLSGAQVKLETLCTGINLSSDKNRWTAIAKDGTSDEFHVVIVTIPVPQLPTLGGTFQENLQEYRTALHEVQYSSRYALALYFAGKTKFDVPWTAKYIHDHPCLRFVCIDSVKRGNGSDSSEASILIHTSVPFGLKHLDSDINEIEKTIHGHFSELFPFFPRPSETRCIRWRYSQVYKPFPGQPGALLLRNEPFLILAGDSFVHSNFSGCIESSLTVFEKFQEHVKTSYLKTE